jgi:hypothetical protein
VGDVCEDGVQSKTVGWVKSNKSGEESEHLHSDGTALFPAAVSQELGFKEVVDIEQEEIFGPTYSLVR